MASSLHEAVKVQQHLARISVCAIADAMAKLNIQGHLLDISLVRGLEVADICGPALTVQVVPTKGSKVYKLPYHYIDEIDQGQVIVISAPESSTFGVFGGLLATAAKARGAAGVITDGRVRDVQEIRSIGLPTFSRGTSVHGQQGKSTVADVNCPVVVGGCVIRCNDIIRADCNGVIVIPNEHATEIASKAEVIEKQDDKIAEAVKQGAMLEHSFERFRAKM